MASPNSETILRKFEDHLGRVANFNPYTNFKREGITERKAFAALIQADPAFSAFGFHDDRYIVARLGGNLITSLHRKIGDAYQDVFDYLVECRLGLNPADCKFSVDVRIGRRKQKRSTDGMIPAAELKGVRLPSLPKGWEKHKGLGFELRSCYQIGDSKRIQADYDMALALKSQQVLPVMLVFCATSLKSPIVRLGKSWCLFQGQETFAFIHDLTNFDLAKFMAANKERLAKPIVQALSRI